MEQRSIHLKTMKRIVDNKRERKAREEELAKARLAKAREEELASASLG